MAEISEWSKRSASLNCEQASKEYDLTFEVIRYGIQIGELDYREENRNGRRYLRVLRSQLESFLGNSPIGSLHLARIKAQKELFKLEKGINLQLRALEELMVKKADITSWLAQNPTAKHLNSLTSEFPRKS